MIIYDNIHGYINIDELASSIIETPIFQRLRNIHQTGVLYLVFPTACHSRFEHSIGTYYLSKLMITNIKNSNKELNISEELISLVSIAGLCHDLGHLLFSHLFDNEFIPNLEHYEQLKLLTDNIYHQNRSTYLLKYLVIKYNINLNNDQLQIINDLINPNDYLLQYNKWNDKYKIGTWIFQIIANPINSIDVDKFDYLTRDSYNIGLKLNFDYIKIINNAKVINNNICYSLKCSEDIYNMFFIRYRLHRQIYNHKKVKAIEILIIKKLFELEKKYIISEYLFNPEKMVNLIDSFIYYDENISNNNILNTLNTENIPKMIYQNISLNEISKENEKEIVNKLELLDKSYKIIKYKVGYCNDNINPFNNIIFYNIKDNTLVKNSSNDFSLLINQEYQEYFFRIYTF